MLRRCAWLLLVCCALTQTARAQDTIKWRTDYNQARKEAQEKNLPLLIDFYTQNCFWCKELERKTFIDTKVIALVNEKFIPLKADGERETNLVSYLQISGFPTIVVAGPDGRLLAKQVGFEDAAKFTDSMQQALTKVTPPPAAAPDWMERDLQLAGKWIEKGDYARAVSSLRTIAEEGKGRPAQEKAQKLLAELEKKGEERLILAKELAEKGQAAAAVEALTETVRLFPGLQASRSAGDMLARIAAGAEERRLQRGQKAQDLLRQARDFHKDKEYVLCLDRCELLVAGFGDLPEGQEAGLLLSEIRGNPEWLQGAADTMSERLGNVYLALADSLLKRGQPQRAEFYLQRIIHAFPGSRHAESAQIRLGQLQGTPTRQAEVQSARP